MIEIVWEKPFKIKCGDLYKFRRNWLIPVHIRKDFFNWWNKNKFRLLDEGFSVTKKDDDWFLSETKISTTFFKKIGKDSFSNQPTTYVPPKDDGFVLTPVQIKNKEGLRPWQVDSVGYIISSINQWGGAIDGSDMGTGKSYSAIGVIRELDSKFIIVCPKAVMSQWRNIVDSHFKVTDKCLGIINYELLIRGRKDSDIASYVKKRTTRREEFVWKLPKNTIIIWDEAHKLKNFKTQNSKTCINAYKQGYKQVFLSASLATTPLELRTVGTCLKMFKTANEYYQFLYNHGCTKGMWGMEFNNDKNVLVNLHKQLFNKRGIRLKRDEIPNFPECEVEVDPYDMDKSDTEEINRVYDEMHKELAVLDKRIKKDGDNELTVRLRSRQKIEIIKVPLIYDMVNEAIEAGLSVVIFLNFSASIDALANRLNTKCIFDGRLDDKVREQNKEDFQSNKEKVIIINSSAGGTGLSIGDVTGNHPRISLISPDDNCFKIKQTMGRTVRENSKSKSIIRFIYISNTIEEKVAANVKQKLNNLDLLNDGDLLT